jgi:hypothetical protein
MCFSKQQYNFEIKYYILNFQKHLQISEKHLAKLTVFWGDPQQLYF